MASLLQKRSGFLSETDWELLENTEQDHGAAPLATRSTKRGITVPSRKTLLYSQHISLSPWRGDTKNDFPHLLTSVPRRENKPGLLCHQETPHTQQGPQCTAYTLPSGQLQTLFPLLQKLICLPLP